jgi:hypothetical protein
LWASPDLQEAAQTVAEHYSKPFLSNSTDSDSKTKAGRKKGPSCNLFSVATNEPAFHTEHKLESEKEGWSHEKEHGQACCRHRKKPPSDIRILSFTAASVEKDFFFVLCSPMDHFP